MVFDPASLTGPLGGIIAIAYGAGAASGYAFCLRTMYKILKAQAEKDEKECEDRLAAAQRDNDRLIERLDTKQIQIDTLNERLIGGMARQADQIRSSGMKLLESKRGSKDE